MIKARARRGFTVVELVLVLAILSLIAGIAVPRYASSSARYRVKAAARRVAADIENIRNAARAMSTQVTLEFKVSSQGYYTCSHVALINGGPDNTVRLFEDPYQVQIAKADFAGDTNLVFDGHGQTVGGEIIVAYQKWAATIVVDGSRGGVTVTAP